VFHPVNTEQGRGHHTVMEEGGGGEVAAPEAEQNARSGEGSSVNERSAPVFQEKDVFVVGEKEEKRREEKRDA